MLIRNIDDIEKQPVQMEGVKDTTMAVMVGRSDGAPGFAMRHLEVAPGGNTPRHSHDYEHEVFVISGAGTVLLEGAQRPIRGGDAIFVPADSEHQFKAADSEPLRFLCMVPMNRDCGQPVPGS